MPSCKTQSSCPATSPQGITTVLIVAASGTDPGARPLLRPSDAAGATGAVPADTRGVRLDVVGWETHLKGGLQAELPFALLEGRERRKIASRVPVSGDLDAPQFGLCGRAIAQHLSGALFPQGGGE